jgi:hypothetical protein
VRKNSSDIRVITARKPNGDLASGDDAGRHPDLNLTAEQRDLPVEQLGPFFPHRRSIIDDPD